MTGEIIVIASALVQALLVAGIISVAARRLPMGATVVVGLCSLVPPLCADLLAGQSTVLPVIGVIGSCAILAIVMMLNRKLAAQQEEITWQRQLATQRAQRITYISHEMRTPMSLIAVSTDLLLERLSTHLQPKEVNLLRVIRRNVDSITLITEQTLLNARAEASLVSPQFRTSDLRRLVASVVSELRPLSAIPILIESSSAPRPVHIDPSLIRQVLINIINNAVQPGRGATVVKVRLFQSDEGATVFVSDDGKGMTAEQRRTLFNLYKSDQTMNTNIGAGLAISKLIVDLHHGKMLIDTLASAGTTIVLHLPSEAQ